MIIDYTEEEIEEWKRWRDMIEKKRLLREIPFSDVIIGEFGLLNPDWEIVVDGDRQVVKIFEKAKK